MRTILTAFTPSQIFENNRQDIKQFQFQQKNFVNIDKSPSAQQFCTFPPWTKLEVWELLPSLELSFSLASVATHCEVFFYLEKEMLQLQCLLMSVPWVACVQPYGQGGWVHIASMFQLFCTIRRVSYLSMSYQSAFWAKRCSVLHQTFVPCATADILLDIHLLYLKWPFSVHGAFLLLIPGPVFVCPSEWSLKMERSWKWRPLSWLENKNKRRSSSICFELVVVSWMSEYIEKSCISYNSQTRAECDSGLSASLLCCLKLQTRIHPHPNTWKIHLHQGRVPLL